MRILNVNHAPFLYLQGPGNQNQPYYSAGPYPGAPFGPMQGVPCGIHSNQGRAVIVGNANLGMF
jgi:hypothetical protein